MENALKGNRKKPCRKSPTAVSNFDFPESSRSVIPRCINVMINNNLLN